MSTVATDKLIPYAGSALRINNLSTINTAFNASAQGTLQLVIHKPSTTNNAPAALKLEVGSATDFTNSGILVSAYDTGSLITYYEQARRGNACAQKSSWTWDGSAARGDETLNSNVTISGDLTVNGTTTTVNSSVVTVDDPNVTYNAVANPTDANADGGGITLKGDTDKIIAWTNSTDSWHYNQGIRITSGYLGAGLTAAALCRLSLGFKRFAGGIT